MRHCKPGYFEHEAGYEADSLGIDFAGCLGGRGLLEGTQLMLEGFGDSLYGQVGDRLIEPRDSQLELAGNPFELGDNPFELGDSQFEVGTPDLGSLEHLVDSPAIPEGILDCSDSRAEEPGTL